jgi:Cu(I)/Ag(I) efflux system membrane fusion protein
MKNKLKNILIIVFVGLAFSCNTEVKEPVNENVHYTCSMDPQVMESKPGKCPICKMDLTKVEGNSGALKFSEEQIKLANIKVDTAKLSALTQEQSFTAKVAVDENESSVITTRVMGRIDKLYFKNMGEYINKGDVVYDLYSEDLSAAQKEYLIALERAQKITTIGIDYKQLLSAAKNKLLLWGMNEKQIEQLAKSGEVPAITSFFSTADGYITEVMIQEGAYVMQGQSIFKTNTLSSVWVEAQVYSSEIAGIKTGQEALVTFDGLNSETQKTKISFISPELLQQTKVNIVRVQLSNSKHQYFPGMLATITLSSFQKKALVLPLDAVLQEAAGNTVWMQNPDGTFEYRMVTIGSQNSKQIEILSGIEIGDRVVVSGAYLINSEYRLKKGSDPMKDMGM